MSITVLRVSVLYSVVRFLAKYTQQQRTVSSTVQIETNVVTKTHVPFLHRNIVTKAQRDRCTNVFTQYRNGRKRQAQNVKRKVCAFEVGILRSMQQALGAKLLYTFRFSMQKNFVQIITHPFYNVETNIVTTEGSKTVPMFLKRDVRVFPAQ